MTEQINNLKHLHSLVGAEKQNVREAMENFIKVKTVQHNMDSKEVFCKVIVPAHSVYNLFIPSIRLLTCWRRM